MKKDVHTLVKMEHETQLTQLFVDTELQHPRKVHRMVKNAVSTFSTRLVGARSNECTHGRKVAMRMLHTRSGADDIIVLIDATHCVLASEQAKKCDGWKCM